ncbi:MAG: hypothetical protein PHR39_07020 [Actinomycetota bacterium]|nr:hypothetical protein [Actinomycetota bacterium]
MLPTSEQIMLSHFLPSSIKLIEGTQINERPSIPRNGIKALIRRIINASMVNNISLNKLLLGLFTLLVLSKGIFLFDSCLNNH